jgi:hypothetical protein
MKQSIAGVSPPDLGEVTVMTVWPSVSATGIGRLLGRAFQIKLGIPPILTLGNLVKLAAIPLVIPLYMGKLAPRLGRRYTLTNRRILIQTGLSDHIVGQVSLDDFDAVDVVVLPGQEWHRAGELVFRKGQVETFRLSGVPLPQTFRRTCLETHAAYVGAGREVKRQLASA